MGLERVEWVEQGCLLTSGLGPSGCLLIEAELKIIRQLADLLHYLSCGHTCPCWGLGDHFLSPRSTGCRDLRDRTLTQLGVRQADCALDPGSRAEEESAQAGDAGRVEVTALPSSTCCFPYMLCDLSEGRPSLGLSFLFCKVEATHPILGALGGGKVQRALCGLASGSWPS